MDKIKKEFYGRTQYLLGSKFNEFEQQAIWDWIEEKLASQLEPLGYTTVAVLAEYEDELPKDLTEEDYNRMFPLSKVDIVRSFPYVEINNHKYYLKVV
ncbi:MAG: hypothetical protein WC974_08430 [Thermoplasmata archaeon]